MSLLTNKPNHVALIMDGNGRWAKSKGKSVLKGHTQGVEVLEDIIRTSVELGIKSLTLYAFSTENWKREPKEIKHLFSLINTFYAKKYKELLKEGVKFNFPGSKDNLDQKTLDLFDSMIKESSINNTITINICFNYGSRQEIVDSVNSFIKENKDTLIKEEDIMNNLYTGINEEIDLIIRTSGEHRLSNFLLYQASYSEFVFTDVLWPDFSKEEYIKCLEEFSNRKRRFGGR